MGWDSRFINDRIPELYPRDKLLGSDAVIVVSKSVKPTERFLLERVQELQKRLKSK